MNLSIMQGIGNINAFMSIFKQRITDNFVQNWSEQLKNSTRANTYKLISDFHFKTYLDFITVRKFRYAFTRLRVSSHRLQIEAGRWHKLYKLPVETYSVPFLFIFHCMKGTRKRRSHFVEQSVIFQNHIFLLLVSYMSQSMHANPNFITKR